MKNKHFKTTWLEFQKAIQTAAEQGKTELRILDFKITWSEFQKPSQTAAAEAKQRYVHLNMVRDSEGKSDCY